ncbi:guanine nucleotide-binding protein subunit gamma 2 [Anaeramoeba ignava]|uniref:Guanine nucleotide-binding protein subunit gamma 2 n=1 Tax=Anaeramoeba ignava TaxID=1746090 RepID=A0A9Q0RCE4_ANAIG|nr:guanine nucleotide-binding protein subunit gamma 2 [Anaeramoeba ignava]
MSEAHLNRKLNEIDRLEKELKQLGSAQKVSAICSSLILYTENIKDPLSPGYDSSKNPWVKEVVKPKSGMCILI